MNWEAVTAVSSAFTSVVIFLTVVYAARQVGAVTEQARATVAQIEHLRRSTQLEGMHEFFDQVIKPDFTDAYAFVLTDFRERMKDEGFRTEALSRGASRMPAHKEFVICRTFESMGTCVKFGMIEADPIYDFAGPTIIECWKNLEELVLAQRIAWSN